MLRSADELSRKVQALVKSAESIAREYTAIESAYRRAVSTIRRLSGELFHARRAVLESRRRASLLFWALLAVVFLFFALK